MKKIFLVALMLLNTSVAYAQTAPVTENTYTMGDDGYIQVKLPFTFEYYNMKFNDSWMYDNGIISFVDPTNPNALPPWQWSAQSLDTVSSRYFIAPLWADLAPVTTTRYITQSDGTYMKYIWQDIAEYYSIYGTLRINTFSTTIKDTGAIDVNYTKINLQSSAITVGTVGNPVLGEYNQIYQSACCAVLNQLSDWAIAGKEPPIVVVPPTVEETYVTPIETIEPTVIVEVAESPTNTVTTTAIVQTATESSPGSVTTASTIAITESSGTRNIDATAIARENQKNLAAQTSAIVNSSIESSTSQPTDNISGEMSVNITALQFNVASVDTSGQDQSGMPNVDTRPDRIVIGNSSVMYDQMSDDTNPTSVRNLANLSTIQIVPENENKTQDLIPTDDTGTSELAAVGIKITDMQILPIGYNNYLALIVPDGTFYSTKEIYRNQTVIDNAPTQRLMTLASDVKFEQMVSQQYGEQK